MRNRMKNVPWRIVIPASVVGIVALLVFLFRVTAVTVEGNTFFSEEVVASEVCSTFLDKNVITAFIKNHLGFSTNLPYVREYEISYPGRHEIHIKLYEKKIIAGIVRLCGMCSGCAGLPDFFTAGKRQLSVPQWRAGGKTSALQLKRQKGKKVILSFLILPIEAGHVTSESS